MKKLLLLVLLSTPLFAQVVQSGYVTYVTSAPSGSCSQNNRVRVVMGAGTVYTCQSSTWATVGGGGGSGVTSFSGDGTILSNSASTGAVTATLANTPTGTGGVVLATSPTLVTPALGTPSAVVLTNGTGLPESGVTNLTSDLALKAPLASPTFTGTVTLPTVTNTGTFTNSQNGAASQSAITLTGSTFTGGSATTTFPYFYYNAGTAPTTWSTNGTIVGINAPSGYVGNYLDFHTNGGASVFSYNTGNGLNLTAGVVASGPITAGAAQSFIISGRAKLLSPADGVWEATNNAATSFTRLDFGGTTSSFAALGTSGTTITAQLADGTAGGTFAASKYATVANCSNAASPAVCAAANAGVVAVPTGTNPTLTINTTAITATSQIFLQIDESATIAATTCNTTLSTLVQPVVTARTAATSFTIQIGAIIATNPACVSYFIVN